MSNKLYRGIREGWEAKVYVDDNGISTELSIESSKVLRPSEATWEWGYYGDGPSQTALAILYDVTGDAKESLKYYHEFKRWFIGCADYQLGFTILESQVNNWLQQMHEVEGNDKGWIG
jgi:hypothetical protein